MDSNNLYLLRLANELILLNNSLDFIIRHYTCTYMQSPKYTLTIYMYMFICLRISVSLTLCLFLSLSVVCVCVCVFNIGDIMIYLLFVYKLKIDVKVAGI